MAFIPLHLVDFLLHFEDLTPELPFSQFVDQLDHAGVVTRTGLLNSYVADGVSVAGLHPVYLLL